MKRPDIFNYHDYKNFLKDWFEYRKSRDKDFSLRKLAKEGGISHGYFRLIVKGDRKFTKKAVTNLIPILKFSESEENYFKLLVVLGDVDTQEQRLEALEKIQRFREYRKLHPQETESYRYLTKWYYVAIREMAVLPGFSLDPVWIQSHLQFQVPLAEVSKAVGFLVEHGFIVVGEQGQITLPEKNLRCVDGIYRLALAQFHRETLELAMDAIENVPREERKIGAYALAIPGKKFERVKELLDGLVKSLRDMQESKDPSDIVYYVTFAGFPLTKKLLAKVKKEAA